MLKQFSISIFLSLFLLFSQYGENIRGPVVNEVYIEGEGGIKKQISIYPSQLVPFYLGENIRFLKGIQFEIVLSESLKRYSDSFALVIYSNVTPEPRSTSTDIVDYNGKKLFFQVLPFFKQIYVKIPYGKDASIEDYLSPGTFSISKSVEKDNFPLILSIQPIMKGVPDSVFSKINYINIEPEVEKKGVLKLSVLKPEGYEDDNYEVFIDDELVEVIEGEHIIDSGIHQLLIKSDNFKEEPTSFSIESGNTTKVEIILEVLESFLSFDTTKDAVIFFDGEKVDLSVVDEIPIIKGIHTLIIKVGEQTITKKLDIMSGKRYNISLIFDIEIKEN